MVLYPVAQGQGQNRQRCLSTGSSKAHEDVQFPRVQRYVATSLQSSSKLLPPETDVESSATDTKIVYRRYASLFFIAGCSSDDNELITLEIIHRYVEQMDKYYGNVCELDIIFSFTKAYYILDELLLAGELQESSKKTVLRCIGQQDSLEDMEVSHAQIPPFCAPLFIYLCISTPCPIKSVQGYPSAFGLVPLRDPACRSSVTLTNADSYPPPG